MSTRLVLDVSEYPALVGGHRGPLWWGMLGLVIIESVVFASFLSGYYYFRFTALEWPPIGEAYPEIVLPTINTLILLLSSATIYYADTSISERGDQRALKIGLSVSILLALTFLALKIVEYRNVEYFWDTHAYGSVIWTIVIFHSAHVGSVVLKAIVVLVLAFRGYWTEHRSLGVKVNGLYWHFVVGIWIPLYFTIYWVPRLN
jgi:cytochrome c oxidase subunit III